MNRDEEIQTSIRARLQQELHAASDGVSVTVVDRIIVLDGSVGDAATRAAVEALAQQHPLARGYASSIRIVPDASAALPADPGTHHDDRAIHIDLGEKWAVLSGEVDWTHQRVRAERCMRRIEGFRSILNRLSVRPHVPGANSAGVIQQSPQPG